MKNQYRKLYTGFWEDADIESNFDKEERYFYIFLLTNPKSTQWGIYEITVKYISEKTGFTQAETKEMLRRFEQDYEKILYSIGTNELCVRNALKWNMEGVNPSVAKHAVAGLSKVKNKSLLSGLNGLRGMLRDYGFAEKLLSEADESVYVPSYKRTRLVSVKPKVKRTVEDVEIPTELLDVADFKKTWNQFLEYRKKDKKKPVSPMQADVLLNEILERYLDGEIEPTKILKKTIANGWQGIFFDGGKSIKGRRAQRLSSHDSNSSEGKII